MPGGRAWRWVLVALVVLAVLPFVLSPAAIGVTSRILIAALFALAFNLLSGQGGMLSFGHAAYLAVGAFATVHAMNALDRGVLWLPTPLLPLAGALGGFAFGAVAGYFATLRSGVYFSMVTLAIAELLHTLAPNLSTVFGGEAGISSMRQPWLGMTFGSEREVYALVLAWTAIATAALYAYTRTPFGRLTVALRENENRIAFLGFNPHLSKVLMFATSATFAGLAGGLLAITTESANYALLGLGYSASVILHTFIGGSGVFFGPALGAAVLTLFGYVASDLTRLWLLYQGLIFVIVMMYLPAGIGGTLMGFAAAARHAPRRRLGAWSSAMIIGLAFAAAGVVFACETVGAMLGRDYVAQVERLGRMVPISVFGRQWEPGGNVTWLVPLVLIGAGSLVFAIARRRARALLGRADDDDGAAGGSPGERTAESTAAAVPLGQPTDAKT